MISHTCELWLNWESNRDCLQLGEPARRTKAYDEVVCSDDRVVNEACVVCVILYAVQDTCSGMPVTCHNRLAPWLAGCRQ